MAGRTRCKPRAATKRKMNATLTSLGAAATANQSTRTVPATSPEQVSAKSGGSDHQEWRRDRRIQRHKTNDSNNAASRYSPPFMVNASNSGTPSKRIGQRRGTAPRVPVQKYFAPAV